MLVVLLLELHLISCDRVGMRRGPGAGAEVTAAGIFSDLIQVAHGLGTSI